jgi:hypothetical protein
MAGEAQASYQERSSCDKVAITFIAKIRGVDLRSLKFSPEG